MATSSAMLTVVIPKMQDGVVTENLEDTSVVPGEEEDFGDPTVSGPVMPVQDPPVYKK